MLIRTALSLAMVASFALAAGGAWQIFRRGNVRQGLLMLLAAAVFFANVLVWSL